MSRRLAVGVVAAAALFLAASPPAAASPAAAHDLARGFAPACQSRTFLGSYAEKVCMDTEARSAEVETRILRVKTGECTLTPDTPTCTTRGSVGSYKATTVFTADFVNNTVNSAAETCVPLAGCQKSQRTYAF
ncbi:hypothetical protein [Streptomyces sp. NPDC091268]|uniref:hypothetical protein n=1 Tax=Streptomyces sp. NPDC091268 TaxID=3365979 RepID=UPI00381C5B9C